MACDPGPWSPQLALWLGRAVAGKIARDPDGVLHHGYRNLGRMRLREGGASDEVLAEWQALLEAGPEAAMATLTSPTASAIRLRAQSPFRRVLSRKEHAMVLAAFDKYWRTRAPSELSLFPTCREGVLGRAY